MPPALLSIQCDKEANSGAAVSVRVRGSSTYPVVGKPRRLTTAIGSASVSTRSSSQSLISTTVEGEPLTVTDFVAGES